MIVGSVAVQSHFGLYVFCYLSELSFLFMFIVVCYVVAVSSFRLCLVLILVDSFLRYPQLDKMPVFYVLGLVVHLCFIS